MRRFKPRRARGPKSHKPQAISESAGPRRKPAIGNAFRRKSGCLIVGVFMILATTLLLVVLL